MRKRKPTLELIEESQLQTIARIIGPFSAAGRVLRDAKERRDRGEAVYFFTDGNYFVVRGKKCEEIKAE